MSEVVTAPKARIPAEFTGLARQFIREVDEDDRKAADAVGRLFRPIIARLVRAPRANLRDGKLAALAADWEAVPRQYRLGFAKQIDRRGRCGQIAEISVGPCTLEHDDWAVDEPAVSIFAHTFESPRQRGKPSLVVLATVGMHALARRFQRGRDRSFPVVLGDLGALVLADIHDVAAYPEGERFHIPAGNGVWAGETTSVETKSGPYVQFVVRTFIDRE